MNYLRQQGEGIAPLVALYRGRSLISRLIRWQTRSPYSHAAIWIPGCGVIESWSRGGVSFNPALGSCHTPGTVVDLFYVRQDCDPALYYSRWHRALEFALSQIGYPYDFRSVARFVSHLSTRQNGRWFCSELVLESLRKGGFNILDRVSSAEVAPGHLHWSPALESRGSITTASDWERQRRWEEQQKRAVCA